MKKNAFTLIEVLISVTIFSIVMIFLYQALEITKTTNNFYEDKLEVYKTKSDLKKLFFDDFLYSIDENNSISITQDKNKNNLVSLNTYNTFHNSFYTHIVYFISRENELIRIESSNKFNKENITTDFLNKSYIDIIMDNIEVFKITPNKTSSGLYTLYIKEKDNDGFYFTVQKL